MNAWVYNARFISDISQLPAGAYGFIYLIEHLPTGKWYIGRKNLYSERNIKLGKRALAAREDKRASKKKKTITESDWKTYHGSEPTLLKDVELHGYTSCRRQILHVCFDKTSLTYEEVRHQILRGCLESDNCYNNNIAGRYFRKKNTLASKQVIS